MESDNSIIGRHDLVATRTVKTVQQFVHTEPDGAVRRTHPEKKWSFKAPMSLNSGKSRLVWWVEVDATLGMGGQKCRQGRHASHWCRTNSSSLLNTEFF